jgi:hypothetical protein
MSIEEGKAGYPEEQPSGADPTTDDTPASEDATPPEADRAPDNEDGTATGHPGSAGATDT